MAEPVTDEPGARPHALAAVLSASDDAVVGLDLRGAIHIWNSSAERLYGHTASEVMGRSVGMLIPPDRAEELGWMLELVRSGRRIDHHETVGVAKRGHAIDVSITLCPITDGPGSTVGAIMVVRDIGSLLRTDLALRTTEARWRAIVDSAVDAIVVIDSKGMIEAFNPAAERMFGYTRDEAMGRSVTMLMPSPYREEHDGYLGNYLRSGVPKIIGLGREVSGLRRDGTTFPVHLSVGEMHVGSERHFTGILHDLSARLSLEGQLREQAALARLGEMAAVIAHEVRNPLTAVRGAVQVIGGRLPPDSRDAPITKEIVARLDALNDLIEDLLLFARPPSPRLAPVDVKQLLHLTVSLLSRDPAFGRVRIDVGGAAPQVVGDAEFLKIVFQNLLINAAQAMHGEGEVRVAIASNGRSCQITIADTGPGIAPEAREKLFRPFFTTKARGTGLGLATAKRLIEAHRGTIKVETPPEGGTVVAIQLPEAAELEAAGGVALQP